MAVQEVCDYNELSELVQSGLKVLLQTTFERRARAKSGVPGDGTDANDVCYNASGRLWAAEVALWTGVFSCPPDRTSRQNSP